MAKQIIPVSFDKSEKDQWLFNIANGENTDYNTLPKKSVLMKIALEFYLNSIGIKFNSREKSIISSKILEAPEILTDKTTNLIENIKEVTQNISNIPKKELVQEIQDEEINIID